MLIIFIVLYIKEVVIVSCNMNFNLFDAIFLFFVGGK